MARVRRPVGDPRKWPVNGVRRNFDVLGHPSGKPGHQCPGAVEGPAGGVQHAIALVVLEVDVARADADRVNLCGGPEAIRNYSAPEYTGIGARSLRSTCNQDVRSASRSRNHGQLAFAAVEFGEHLRRKLWRFPEVTDDRDGRIRRNQSQGAEPSQQCCPLRTIARATECAGHAGRVA